ncbi:hypothetical protein PG996_011156 [Apiospora saccharicola]|uniref:Uncharacterized protein n=1 Tax=Apiospora saccharicola TaxID=335842 RepID=A0ABR1UEA5_9PEZI
MGDPITSRQGVLRKLHTLELSPIADDSTYHGLGTALIRIVPSLRTLNMGHSLYPWPADMDLPFTRLSVVRPRSLGDEGKDLYHLCRSCPDLCRYAAGAARHVRGLAAGPRYGTRDPADRFASADETGDPLHRYVHVVRAVFWSRQHGGTAGGSRPVSFNHCCSSDASASAVEEDVTFQREQDELGTVTKKKQRRPAVSGRVVVVKSDSVCEQDYIFDIQGPLL